MYLTPRRPIVDLTWHQMDENAFSDIVVRRRVRCPPMRCERVGVVGTGIMGVGIAEVMASAGFEVVVRSRHETTAETTVMAIDKNLSRLVGKGRCTEEEKAAILGRLTTTTALRDLAGCDLVIEAAPEDLELKRELFGDLGNLCRPDAVLATNTSTLSIIDLAVAAFHPERVVGMHFFNPAPVMPLVEIGRPLTASPEAVSLAVEVVERCGKHGVAVRDSTGFIVNALLFGYLGNAVGMYERGLASLEDIDTAMTGGCNFPMGPFALYDLIGIDVCVAVFDALFEEYRDPQYACPPLLRRMVAAGRLGRKSGRGFYVY